ncbi:MAG TPA: biotin/lipoyl-containing protein, partial [Candidatus Competibacteraceae bacterium]|nr:biotin/lipoyl-containing protein [Candidatus Competibacteraceae bacterium]
MSIEVRVPTLPESVADATLVTWHKKPGDPVKVGENLVDLETDKVVLEIPAPADGVMGTILRGDGETVTTGDLIATLEAAGAQPAAAAAIAEPAVAAAPAAAVATPAPAMAAAAAPAATIVDLEGLSPAVRRLVAENNLDIGKVHGSGRDGRVTKADVLAYLNNPAPAAAVAIAPAAAPAARTTPTLVEPPIPSAAPSIPPDARGRLEQRVPMTRLRARIAERLVEAQQTAA